jgi:hypothetical protein
LLTPMGIAEKVALTTRFLSRKMEEYEALKLEIEALKSEVDSPGQDKTRLEKHDPSHPLSSSAEAPARACGRYRVPDSPNNSFV